MVLGHESSGVVSSIGDAVTSVKVGDRVAIEPGVPSRLSDEYKGGKYNLCPHMVFAATPNSVEGEPNPPGTLELGALVEPLTVGVHAAKLASIRFRDIVVVFGAGPVGLLAASVAKLFGASEILIVDIADDKLQLAQKIGVADFIFNSKTGGGASDLIKAFNGKVPTVVLECTGAPPCIKLAVEILKPGGRMVQIGNAGGDVQFPITEFATKELTLFGSFRYGFEDYKTAVAILDENYKNGKEHAPVDYESLITHRYKFKDAVAAYDFVKTGGAVKCIIDGPE
ncbi:Endo-1,4-beta-xylanase 2 [Cerrena zonata]|uniref:Endo-1,4-beta-xylanase 2 n=1 Tax=Cerrena zonata TaxID=2478898 RepID=A0AAW0FIC3_9APHY